MEGVYGQDRQRKTSFQQRKMLQRKTSFQQRKMLQRKTSFQARNSSFWERTSRHLCHANCLSKEGGGEGHTPVTDYLNGANQKIPDWVIKTTFWGKVEIAGKSGFKSSLISWDLAQVIPFWPPGSLFNISRPASSPVPGTL